MIYSLIKNLWDINFLAQFYLRRFTHKKGMIICRGRVQINLSSSTILKANNKVSYIGIPLLGFSTPRDEVTVIYGENQAIISLDKVTIGRGVKLSIGATAYLSIGSNSYITDGSQISAQNSISIGKNCAISFGVTIIDDDGHGFGEPPYSAPIVIEDDVWIGCNVTILKGVTIGKGSVVAAGAVVNKSCPPHSLLAGVPARVVKEGVSWTDKSRIEQSSI